MGCKVVADDYGMSYEVNHAISELVNKNIVSKIGVMANESIEYSMSDIGRNVEFGLHINLTTYTKGKGINLCKRISLLKLLYLIYMKQESVNKFMDNIKHQFEIVESRGFKISYIDTHMHIHVFPKLSRLIINYAKANGISSIRCITMERRHLFFYVYSLIRFGFLTQVPKMILLYFLGGKMKPRLDSFQVKYCKNLVLMPLATSGNYSGLFKEFLKRFKNEGSEIVTHPGLETKTKFDKYTTGRYIEYCALLNQK